MRSTIVLMLLSGAVAGCSTGMADEPQRGVEAVNAPVVARNDFVFDAAAPGGMLAPGEAERLNGWFQGLDLGYGDSVYVDGGYADAARNQIAQVAGSYGLLVTPGSPVAGGPLVPGAVRVIVSRTRASVPGCPNWSGASQPNYMNRMMPNFGCAVNSNLAAMVANPEDLVHGREGSAVGDAMTASKAVGAYRRAEPTGTKGLSDIRTKKDDK